MWLISKHGKGAETVGLYAAQDEAVAIHAAPSSGGLAVLTDVLHLGQQSQTFKEAVAHAHLRGRRANGVLAMSEYQLLMVDAPDVPAEELRSAVKWKIRDLINFHIDDVDEFAIDAFGHADNDILDLMYLMCRLGDLLLRRAHYMSLPLASRRCRNSSTDCFLPGSKSVPSIS